MEAEIKDVDDILKHYGVLGMKWGVRRTPEQLAAAAAGGGGGGGDDDEEDVTEDELSDEEKAAWEEAKKNGFDKPLVNFIFNRRINEGHTVNRHGHIIESKEQKAADQAEKDRRPSKPDPLPKAKAAVPVKIGDHRDPVSKAATELIRRDQEQRYPDRKVTVDDKGRVITTRDYGKEAVDAVKDATDNTLDWFDKQVKKLKQSDLEPQNVEDLDRFLKHYGILGMKWGVRRTPDQIAAAKANRRMKKAKKSDDSVRVTRVKGEDGSEEFYDRKGRRVSSDAATAQALKKRAKREGPQSLSNDQMQDLIKRMNLEQQYEKLNPKKQNPAKKFVADMLKDTGKQAASQISSKYSKQLADAIAASTEKKKKPEA